MKIILITVFLFFNATIAAATDMTQDDMEKFVIAEVEVITHRKGYLLFNYKKVKIALISDVKHDRMRLITAVSNYSSLTPAIIKEIMVSNFHRALDARYALSNDVLYSAFIHPLSALSKKQLLSAINQVSSLALSFGSTYSSGSLTFRDKGIKKSRKSNKFKNGANLI